MQLATAVGKMILKIDDVIMSGAYAPRSPRPAAGFVLFALRILPLVSPANKKGVSANDHCRPGEGSRTRGRAPSARRGRAGLRRRGEKLARPCATRDRIRRICRCPARQWAFQEPCHAHACH